MPPKSISMDRVFQSHNHTTTRQADIRRQEEKKEKKQLRMPFFSPSLSLLQHRDINRPGTQSWREESGDSRHKSGGHCYWEIWMHQRQGTQTWQPSPNTQVSGTGEKRKSINLNFKPFFFQTFLSLEYHHFKLQTVNVFDVNALHRSYSLRMTDLKTFPFTFPTVC